MGPMTWRQVIVSIWLCGVDPLTRDKPRTVAHVPATLLVLSGVVCILSILNEFYNFLIAVSVKH